MPELQMLRDLVEKFRPVAASRMIGVEYETLWRWLNKGQRISKASLTAIRLLWEREFGPKG